MGSTLFITPTSILRPVFYLGLHKSANRKLNIMYEIRMRHPGDSTLTRVLITGSRGFIGSHLKRAFSDTIEFDLKENPSHDIRNSKMVDRFWEQSKPEVVIHLAANPMGCRDKYPRNHQCM